MIKEEHIKRHKELHKALDELIADFMIHTKESLENTNMMYFLTWSHTQTINPTGEHNDD